MVSHPTQAAPSPNSAFDPAPDFADLFDRHTFLQGSCLFTMVKTIRLKILDAGHNDVLLGQLDGKHGTARLSVMKGGTIAYDIRHRRKQIRSSGS